MSIDIDILERTARERLGIPHLYPYQSQTVLSIVNSPRHRLVILPTGAGKSLIFTLPVFFLEGLTVIVYPLLALMDDQRRRFERSGLRSVVLRGGQTREQRRRLWDKVEAERPPILITNPEMLVQAPIRERLARLTIDHLVFDEAHCVSQWGKTFREAYLHCARSALDLRPRRLTALTATADPIIESDLARELFRGEPYQRVARVPDRPNIAYEVWRGLSRRVLLRRALESCERPAIVFVASRMSTVHVARLAARTVPPDRVRVYHAGLSREEKARTERWFFESRDGVLVTTCAYGMGVDKSDVRTVLHWDPSESVVAYLQESGRAGRDGRASRAVLLVDPESRFRSARDRELAFDDTACRRNALLGELGPDRVDCNGCDVCAQSRGSDPLSRDFLHAFQEQRRRGWHPALLGLRLAGLVCPQSREHELHLSDAWGAFAALDAADMEELTERCRDALDRRKISDYICQK